ncbi:MAG: hypothetical protein IPN01_28630 [Deltaproteobacteria bacterium]|nr:hypothetical protein [Deltaproteobacteria bacterium]
MEIVVCSSTASLWAPPTPAPPGGAKKLLTATDYGNNESIDQHLSRTVGADAWWRHLSSA